MPIGGGVVNVGAFLGSGTQAGSSSRPPSPDEIQYYETYHDFKAYAKCTISLHHHTIPSSPRARKLTGVLVTHSSKEIAHSGIFLLLKGSLPKKCMLGTTMPVRSIKFSILKANGSHENEGPPFKIPACTESFPLDLVLPFLSEEMPQPQITSEGKFTYKLQAYMCTGRKYVKIAETTVKYEGYLNLKGIPEKLKIDLQYKKSVLGRKKVVDVFTSAESDSFLPGETIDFLLVTANPSRIEGEYKVELLQKVWYQARTGASSYTEKTSVLMQINSVVVVTKVEEKGNIEEEMIWKGHLKVPTGLSPTYKFDEFNNVSYMLRVMVSQHGDTEHNSAREASVTIGTCRDGDGEDEEEKEDEKEDYLGESCSEIESQVSTLGISPVPTTSRSATCLRSRSRSPRVVLRPRASSASGGHTSFYGLATAIASFLKLPPSYSGLSSRKSTLETLPPSYSQVDVDNPDEAKSTESENL